MVVILNSQSHESFPGEKPPNFGYFWCRGAVILSEPAAMKLVKRISCVCRSEPSCTNTLEVLAMICDRHYNKLGLSLSAFRHPSLIKSNKSHHPSGKRRTEWELGALVMEHSSTLSHLMRLTRPRCPLGEVEGN